jgi:hypothetical protein
MASCFSENGIDPAKPNTFIKYFNDGYNNTAVTIEQTDDDGYIILLNSTIQDTEAQTARDRICLIKTDRFGNQLWKNYYPEIPADGTDEPNTPRWAANAMVLTPDGYLITGESIKENNSDMVVLKVNLDGTIAVSKEFTKGAPNDLIGQAITVKNAVGPTNGNYLVLATSTVAGNKMVIKELNSTTLDEAWLADVSRGDDFRSVMANRLFFNVTGTDSLIYWGGTVTKTAFEASDMRLTASPVEDATPAVDLDFALVDINETAQDICLRNSTFNFVGTINNTGTNTDIYVMFGTDKVSPKTVTYTNEFLNPKDTTGFTNDKNEIGNAIIATSDGGFMVLATIDTYTGVIGRGNTDLLLMKLGPFGGLLWSKPYGSQDADAGKTIRQTSDGGYVALGTTRLAGVRTVLMIKTDFNGNVD